MNDRIGSSCWYGVLGRDDFEVIKWKSGKLLAWSTNSAGPSIYPVGIVEDEKSLTCLSVPLGCICFATVPPPIRVIP
jgi:hypothetical protein